MSVRQETASVSEDVERIIADYLRQHPDFFNRHLDLLEGLRVPHPCRPAVSLVERQLMLLRQQNNQLRKKFRDLVRIARDNDCLSKRMQQLNLVLIESERLDDMLIGIEAVLREDFNADFTAVGLLADLPLEQNAVYKLLPAVAHTLFAPLFESGRPLCGRLTEQQTAMLFGPAAAQIASCALVPLGGPDWKGIVACGSFDSKRFHPGMGTLFLSRIGELISHAVQPHLQLPAALLPARP